LFAATPAFGMIRRSTRPNPDSPRVKDLFAGRISEDLGPEEDEDDRYDPEERDEPPPPRAASRRRDEDRFTAER
jgi:hypothetical protein